MAHRTKGHGPVSKPTPQQVYADLMKTRFAPALRRAGLKGSAGRFQLPSDKYWALLGFQKSAYSDSTEVQFTVNLSVISRDVWTEQVSARTDLGAQPKPGTFYGSWAEQIRIGKLTPTGEDVWWPIKRGIDPEPVAALVVSTLLELGLPWLKSKATT